MMKRVLLVFLIVFVATAAEDFKDYMVQTPKLEAPKRGSLKGDFAELGDKAVSLKTGSFSISLPIKFPSKRGELLHDIIPSYSPAYGISEFGIGWNLNLKMWRMREQGVVDYSDSDMLTGPWGQMIIGDDGYWYPKDLRKKVRAQMIGDDFVVYLEDGKTLTFGLAQKNQDDLVYAWYLTSVEDKVGHRSLFNYQIFADDGAAYLKEVFYGGLEDDYQYKIEINYLETRAPFYDYSCGAKRILDRKVDQISVSYKEDDSYTVRYYYNLSYQDNFLSPSFYLNSLQKFYYGGESEPAITFDYDQPYSFLIDTNWENVPEMDGLFEDHHSRITNYNYISLNDFNRDGQMDMELDQLYNRYIKTDEGYELQELIPADDASSWCLFPVVHSRKPRKFLQVFGPGSESKVYDLFEYHGKTVLDVCEINGSRIDYFVFPKHWEDATRTIFSDINRDGKADLVHLNGHTISYAINRSDLSSGLLFDDPTTPAYIDLPSTFSAFWIRDINGDGQGDLVLKGESTIYVHYGHADGTFSVENARYDFYRSNGMLNSKKLEDVSLLFVDMNKDSLPDILMQGEGFVTVHINDGHRFIQLNMPGLFVNSMLYNNMIVADLTGSGNEQILASLPGQGVLSLKLDRPSLGMLVALNDGKGNRLQFEYTKSSPQEDIQNRKTVVSSMKKITTGEGELDYSFTYGKIAAHSLTKDFLGFIDAKRAMEGMGEEKSSYEYNEDNLDMLVGSESVAYSNPDLVKFTRSEYGDFDYAGIEYVNVVASHKGHRNQDGTQSVSLDSSMIYDGLCESETIKSGSGKSLTVRKSYIDIANFSEHLSCHVGNVKLMGDNYSYQLTINRDNYARPVEIFRGSTLLQQMSYGANGLVSSIVEAGKGVTRISYNSNYLLDGVMAPDNTITSVDGFDAISEEPLNVGLARWTWDFSQQFRFDGWGRLERSWDNMGLFSESSPKVQYQYVFADDLAPGKVLQFDGIEKSIGSLDGNQKVLLQSGKDNPIAVIEETNSSYRLKGLTKYLPSVGQTSKYQDQLLNLDFTSLEINDLDFSQEILTLEEKDYLDSLKSSNTAFQDGVYQSLVAQKYINGEFLVSESVENGSYIERRVSDAWGNQIEYIDQLGSSYIYSFDSLGRVVGIELPDGSTQEIYYDDVLGKVARIVRSGIGSVEYSYDSTTTLLSEKGYYDRNGALSRSEVYSYDGIGRMTRKLLNSFDSTGTIVEFKFYEYFYDGDNLPAMKRTGQLGHLTGVSSLDFEKSFVYRADGKVLEESLTVLNEKKIETYYEYLSHGDVSSKRYIVTDLTSGIVVADNLLSYEYSRFGKVSKFLLNGSEFASFSYDQWEDVSDISLVGLKSLEINYDPLTRESRDYAEKNGSDTIMRQQWSYNERGNIDNSTLTLGSRTVTNDYTYESRGFLQGMSRLDDGGSDLVLGYGYSASGVMNELTRDGVLDTFSLDPSSWEIGGISYGLDSMGRVISVGTKTFTYGVNGRLKSVSTGAGYVYDEEDNPLYKINPDGTKEIYFEEAVLGDEFILPLKIGSRIVGYLRDNNFVATSADHLNSYVVDENGATNLNTPYGERYTRSEASRVIDYALKGYDEDIEAVRMGHRWYSPKAKRFLTADSYLMENLEELVKRPTEINLYSYASNNPISFFDPTGDAVGDRYESQDDAAIDAVNDVNEKSITEDKEYGGYIYKNEDNTFSYTEAVGGGKTSVDLGEQPKMTVADYHTHASYDPKFGAGNNQFSEGDIRGNNLSNISGYLGSPDRNIQKFDYDTQQITKIGSDKTNVTPIKGAPVSKPEYSIISTIKRFIFGR